ncbi:hypothetical protein B9Z55_015975 [Caenorhabditis nigoni]|uniref:F-box domain-containing protein n=1 Tax=Caenorhabditis nigoni TaxID=1611254 RepID=A0A2G5UCM3_9PELO|nr:hypothetical protein B9Z55_015975 [Caenorhabditis nigoni]
MPFPILRTPFVVFSEIISLLEPNEIVTASFCSKKVRRLLRKHHRRREPLNWRLYMIKHECWGQADIITKPHERKRKSVLTAKHISEARHESEHELIQTNEYKRGFSLELPVLYFEDWETGSEMIVDYVSDLFNLDVYGLVTDRNGIWAIDWINNRQEKMLVGIELLKNDLYDWCGDAELDYILRDKCVADYYILEDIVSENFRFNELELVEKAHVVDDRYSDEEMTRCLDGYTIQRHDGVKATIHFGIRYFVMFVWQRSVFQKVL